MKKIILWISLLWSLAYSNALVNNEIYFSMNNKLALRDGFIIPSVEKANNMFNWWLSLFNIYSKLYWEKVTNDNYVAKSNLFNAIYKWLYNKKIKLENCEWTYCDNYKKYDKQLKKEVDISKLRYDSIYQANQDYTKYYNFLSKLIDNIKNYKIKNQLKVSELADTKVCDTKIAFGWIKFSLQNIDATKFKKLYLLWINSSNWFWNPWTKDSVDLIKLEKEQDLKNLPKLFYLKEIKNYKKEKVAVKKYKCKWEIFDYFPKCFPSSKITKYEDSISFTGSEQDIIKNIVMNEYDKKIDMRFVLLWVDKNNNIIILSYYSPKYTIYKNTAKKVQNTIFTVCKRKYDLWGSNKKVQLIRKKLDYIMKKLDKKYSCNFDLRNGTSDYCWWTDIQKKKYWKLLLILNSQLESLIKKYDIWTVYDMNIEQLKNNIKKIERKIFVYNVLEYFKNLVNIRLSNEFYKYVPFDVGFER